MSTFCIEGPRFEPWLVHLFLWGQKPVLSLSLDLPTSAGHKCKGACMVLMLSSFRMKSHAPPLTRQHSVSVTFPPHRVGESRGRRNREFQRRRAKNGRKEESTPPSNSTHTARWICRTNVWGEGLRPGPDLPLDASRMAGSGHGDGPVRLLFATMPTSNNVITV